MPFYSIAGVTVFMEPQHAMTIDRARPYLVPEDTAAIYLSGDHDDAAVEHAALARSFYEQLTAFDGFLLHASAVEWEGKAVAFSAPSGTGKSTHARFWRACLGATAINDDKPAVRLIDGVFHACGTPFSGKHDLSAPVCVPLEAIVFLKQAPETTVRRLSTSEALFALLSQTLRPTDGAQYDRLLTLLEGLLRQTAVYEAGVPLDKSAAADVCRAIFDKTKESGF